MNKIPRLREPRGPIVQQVRDIFLEREFKASPEEFYQEDIKLVENMDFLLQRYVIMQRKHVENSVKMVSQMLRWRKERKLYELKADTFPQELTICGGAFNYEPDKFGNKTLYLRASMCKNCVELKPAMKDFLSYLLFNIDDCKNGSTYAVIMDLTDTTWTNYDLDLLMHFVTLLKDYFPVNLDYVLAINFPWILSAAWGIIKRVIPAEKRDAVHFISSNKILDFIPKENCPDFLGGTCTRSYRYIDENAPTAVDYMMQNSSKTITTKRLREILILFSDILPKDHMVKLKAIVDQISDTEKGKVVDGSFGQGNTVNNNNIEDVIKAPPQAGRRHKPSATKD